MPPTDRVILVTGATGGLGRAVVTAFADHGDRLGLVGTDGDRLAAVAGDAGLSEDRWAAGIGDLRIAGEAAAAVEAVASRFGRVDGLVHAVGGYAGGTAIVDLDPDELESMLGQHVRTTLHVVRAVLPGMVERGWGRIIAVTTPVAATPAAKMAGYAVAKAAEETLIRAVAKEVAGTGVTANLVSVKKIDVDHEREREPSSKNASWTTPEEIAAVIRQLCSDDAAAINGATIPLFGA
jgi:NAD(P)-dependent dehydrogenase (short-subunit alcohol dehydrogenase family)